MPEGLSISTETQGQLVHTSNFRHSINTISITVISRTGADGLFFWRAPGMAEDSVYQIPLSFPAKATPQKVVLDMAKLPEWDSRSDRIGFVLNAGSQMTLQEVSFSGPSAIDKIVYPLKTFFVLDTAHAYSINFLWGPLMTYSEDQLAQVFAQFPPIADSWNIAFYWILGIALVAVYVVRKLFHRNLLTPFFLLFAALWIVYDLRMGAELIQLARTDIKTWWSKPVELQDFRDRASFTAFAKTAVPFTEGKDRYIFIASHGWPFWGSMKYEAYPALPVSHEGDTEGIDTWIVYNRNDILPNNEGRLELDGKPISPPGDIMMSFEPGAFVFVTRP